MAWGIGISSRWPAPDLQLILAAAMRQHRLIPVMESSRNDPEIVSALPHEIFLSSHPAFQNRRRVGLRTNATGAWGATEDDLWFSCLRFSAHFVSRFVLRFVSWHWLCVRRRSPYRLRRLTHGLITAQGVMRAPITPAITRGGITFTSNAGTSLMLRAGSAGWRK
jgi:hypothetical protein